MKKIAMTGASGFVGTNLSRYFASRGWDVTPIGKNDFASGPQRLTSLIEGAEILINLAGAPVIGRWTEGYKKTMYQSRVYLTRQLIEAISTLPKSPSLIISTSAVGYYSSEGEHDEDNFQQADDFLGQMADHWEHEALRARQQDIRTVIFRLGIVLGRGGGALGRMILPFRLGLGGTIGDGAQALSWVHMRDLTRAFASAIEDRSYEGIYNLCSPCPSTNKGLTKALARALRRPAFLRVPALALRLQYGQGAQVLTSGQRVYPGRLLKKGFKFEFQKIDEAVRDCVI